MSTSTSTNIDRALQILIRADVPPRIEHHVRGQIDVLMGLDQTAGLYTSIALQAGQRLARMARLTGSKTLLLAACELGAETEPPATVRNSLGDARVEVTFSCGDQVHRMSYEQAVVIFSCQPGSRGAPERLQLDLTGSRVRTPAT